MGSLAFKAVTPRTVTRLISLQGFGGRCWLKEVREPFNVCSGNRHCLQENIFCLSLSHLEILPGRVGNA